MKRHLAVLAVAAVVGGVIGAAAGAANLAQVADTVASTLGIAGLMAGAWRWSLLRDPTSTRIALEGAGLLALGALVLP